MRVLRVISQAVSSVSVIVMMIIVMMEIVARTFFQYSFLVMDEMSGYLMAATVFLGAVYAFDSGSFIRVEFLYEKSPEIVKRVLNIVFAAVVLVYCFLLTYYMIRLNLSDYRLGSTSTSILRTPLYIPKLSMSFGMVMFDLYLVLYFFRTLMTGGRQPQQQGEH